MTSNGEAYLDDSSVYYYSESYDGFIYRVAYQNVQGSIEYNYTVLFGDKVELKGAAQSFQTAILICTDYIRGRNHNE